MHFQSVRFLQSLAVVALSTAAMVGAPVALAADPPKAVATVPDAAAKAVLAEEADAGHTTTLGAALGLLIVIGIVALIVKKGREPSGPGTGSTGPGGDSGGPPRPPDR